ncbi:MAG: DNA mismatch repair endonuclease MutL, partial [Chloroflexi bacterium]|nr:DNA mismatch repair endonuclease MutL [Chloroflexota bacterium]
MPIRLLPPDVADKIAAGEVIERPVSVAKELLENAIDSGADAIQVLVAQGGRRLVQVVDNGCGIPAAEVPLAFSRHATSKLASAEELYTVRTLGFRGEALASIGAVSRLSLATRARGEELGTLIRMEGGLLGQPEAQGRPFGTSVEVENLFFNTPARLKFLRADTTESGHIARLASSYALAYPEIRFTLHNNGREVLRTTGTGSLYDVLVAVYGLDVAEGMLPIEATSSEGGALRVYGFISAPDVQRSNRSDILFFINRRWVQDNALTYAASQAYQTLLPQRRYPLVVLNIDMPPEDVDVNIHPTKREVRFRHSREVFAMVQRAVRATLLSQRPLPVQPLDEEAWERRQA